MIIFVQCSVVLFPRQLCSKRVETSGGKIVELDKYWWQSAPSAYWGGAFMCVTSSVLCSEQLPLGSLSTPRVLQSVLPELSRHSNSKASAGMAGGLLYFSHCGIWGLGLSGDTKLALHLGLHSALLLRRQLSCVIFYGLLWTSSAEDCATDLFTIMLGSLLNLPSCCL